MAITKAKKEVILSKLETIKKDSTSLVFVGFDKLNVANVNAMRSKLRAEGVGYFVAKKTLMERAFKDAYTGEAPVLPGEVAVAYSTDSIAPAQNVRIFEKQFADQVSILGGVFEGVYKNKAEMTEIASIPSLQVLRGMFAQLLNSPRQRFAVVLSKVSETKS